MSWQNPGVSILNETLRRVKLDDALIRENNEVLHDFLNTFVDKMKEVDELFRLLYKGPYYTGSFYSDLRIASPDEFDINLILNFGLYESEFQITHTEPGFAKYELFATLISTARGLFEDGFLMPENVRAWFQSVIDKAFLYYRPPKSCRRVCAKQAGPARTIAITKNNGSCIDVDLVPVISCTLNLPGSSVDRTILNRFGSNVKAFLVPKPPHPLTERTRNVSVTQHRDARRSWRCHCPEIEEEIIYNIGCAKSVIKLLKLLRDQEQWSILASYYLQTVVMWLIIENSFNRDHWREDKIHERFLEALQKLAVYVGQMRIPYIFNKNCNLIERIGRQEAIGILNRIDNFIRNIKSDPNYLRRIFLN